MRFSNALKEIIHRANTTQKELAKKAGYKTVSSVSTPIASNDIRLSTLVRLAKAAGYNVMLVRENAIEPEYPIKIDYDEDEQ